MARVDVVVVTYNSRRHVRECLADLVGRDDLTVTVVDNASPDRTPEVLAGLPVRLVEQSENRGFANACNVGTEQGESPYVLYLNPDARISADGIHALADILDAEPSIGVIGPKIYDADGGVQFTQHRFPTLRGTFAHALFLHQFFPRSSVLLDVLDPAAYESHGTPDWMGGACLLIRRETLQRAGSFDDRFFMYCEDMDLCRRIRQLGGVVRFEPSVTATHVGGASAPKAPVVPIMARSRSLYASFHRSPTGAFVERLGIALDAAMHAIFGRGDAALRRSQLRAVRAALRPD